MKKSVLGTISALLIVSLPGFAQNYFCATDQMNYNALQAHPELALEIQNLENFTQSYKESSSSKIQTQQAQVYIIPVVFHIIHEYGAENISDAQIYDQMRILNEDYRKLNADITDVVPAFQPVAADCEIEFRLARKDPSGICTTGIDRIVSMETYQGDDGSKLNQWPRNKYLNIWVTQTITTYDSNNNPVHTAAAYAYLPGNIPNPIFDGIICRSDYVGSIGSSNVFTSRTLTHEIGHYLNLQHTWGNTNSPGVACGDDNVTDTPDTKGWTSCPLTNNDVCTSTVEENVQNYMEYAYCDRMFTTGQRTRMRAALNSGTAQRNNLWTTANNAATGTDGNFTAICAPVSDFYSNLNTICAGGAIQYSWNSIGGHPTSWAWTFPGGTPATSTDSFPLITYATAGTYDATLTVSNTAGNNSLTKTNFVQIFSTIATYSTWQWFESFDGPNIPNTDWQVVNVDNNATWVTTNAAGYSGPRSMTITNAANLSGQKDEAMGPGVDMTAINLPILYFQVAYAQRVSTDGDRLQVFVSTNCGQSWILRYNKAGTQLKTVNPSTSNFIPVWPTGWRKETVTIPYPTATNLRVKFLFISAGGNNIYVDDINIQGSATAVVELDNVNGLNIYPNPMNGSSTISFDLKAKANVKIDMLDVLGRNVNAIMNAQLSEGEHQYTINKGTITPGIYFVKLEVDGNVVTRKIVIE